MYLFKYAPRPPVILNLILMLALVLMWLVVYFQGLANGLAYIYQCVVGQLLGLIYLIGCLTFDDEIHRYCEKTGFILRSSRARKFYLFFFTLFLLTVESIIYLSLADTWNMPQDWIVNANFYSQHCKWLFKQNQNFDLGLKATYDKQAALYVLIGATFGQSYSLNYVQPLLWIHTPMWKKVIRMLIPIIPITAYYYLSINYINLSQESPWHYILNWSLINLIESYFIFGLYPILCKKLHLTVTEEQFNEKNPEFYDATPQLAKRTPATSAPSNDNQNSQRAAGEQDHEYGVAASANFGTGMPQEEVEGRHNINTMTTMTNER